MKFAIKAKTNLACTVESHRQSFNLVDRKPTLNGKKKKSFLESPEWLADEAEWKFKREMPEFIRLFEQLSIKDE
jgi:hypothetical protein